MLPPVTYARFARRVVQYWTGTRHPFWISWFVNSECQIRCGGCFFFSREFPRGEPLSSAQRFELLDQIIALKQPYMTLLGGEPFKCKDLFPLARKAMAGGIAVSVTTNGLDISEADLERIDGSFYHIWISIDGPREAHDANRGPGTWDQAVRTLRRLVARKKKTKVGVSTVLSKTNAREMGGFLRMLRALGVDQVSIKDNLLPELRAEGDDFKEAVEQILSVKDESPGFVRQESEFLLNLPAHRANPHGSCFLDTHMHVAIMPDGTVSACVSFPVPIGSVREKPLVEILKPGPKERYSGSQACPGCTRNDYLLFLRFIERPWEGVIPKQALKLVRT